MLESGFSKQFPSIAVSDSIFAVGDFAGVWPGVLRFDEAICTPELFEVLFSIPYPIVRSSGE